MSNALFVVYTFINGYNTQATCNRVIEGRGGSIDTEEKLRDVEKDIENMTERECVQITNWRSIESRN